MKRARRIVLRNRFLPPENNGCSDIYKRKDYEAIIIRLEIKSKRKEYTTTTTLLRSYIYELRESSPDTHENDFDKIPLRWNLTKFNA